jgi:hypothetical protein
MPIRGRQARKRWMTVTETARGGVECTSDAGMIVIVRHELSLAK